MLPDEDYQAMLNEHGISEEYVRSISENKMDRIEMPDSVWPYLLGISSINGTGYFLKAGADENTLLAPANINGLRTHAARYVNHSGAPNARMHKGLDGNIYLVSIKRIGIGEEVTVDYRESIRVSGNKTAVNHSMRSKILRLENALMEGEKIEPVIKHYFADGMYAREMFVPKGSVFVGKIHKTEHICACLMGHFTIVSELRTYDARPPMVVVSKPGTKRVGYAHEDSIWVNFHATNETNVKKIEEELVSDNYELLEGTGAILDSLERIGES